MLRFEIYRVEGDFPICAVNRALDALRYCLWILRLVLYLGVFFSEFEWKVNDRANLSVATRLRDHYRKAPVLLTSRVDKPPAPISETNPKRDTLNRLTYLYNVFSFSEGADMKVTGANWCLIQSL